MVYDLSGKPLNYLLLVGPDVRDFWSTISNPGERDYALWAVGATDKRSFFSAVIPASSFEAIAKTRVKAGSFRRFLSPAPGVLYLEDESGGVWDVFKGSLVNPEQLEREREVQQDIIRQRQADGVLDGVKEAWDQLRQMASQKTTPQGLGFPTLEEVTLPDGQLNVPKVIDALEAQRVAKGISPAYVNERAWCEGWFCFGRGYASVVRKNRYNGDLANNFLYNPDNPEDYSDCPSGPKCRIATGISNADPLGNRQEISRYRSAPPDGFWGAWDFGFGGLLPLDFVGCGPMSIVRLFNWYTTQRQSYGSYNVNLVTSGTPPSDHNQVAWEMFEPVPIGTKDGRTVYQPRIATYTSTRYYDGGGTTLDTNIIPAANRWIQERASAEGKNWEMRGSSRGLVRLAYVVGGVIAPITLPISWWDWTQHTWAVRDVVRGKIGRDNEPVIVFYGRGFTGHFAMSQTYIVHENPFYATVLMWIGRNSEDMLWGSYIDATNLFSFYSGAYGLYRR